MRSPLGRLGRLPFPLSAPTWPHGVPRPEPERRVGLNYDHEWSRRYPVRLARAVVLDNVTRPLARVVAPTTVQGEEYLRRLDGPLIFAANHASHLDAPLLLTSLPLRFRHHTVVAAASDYFFDRTWKSVLWSFSLAAVPIERSRVNRRSADTAAELIEDGWNLVIFPEGGRSPDGWGQPFRGGAAYLARRTGVPVVPVHLGGTRNVVAKRSPSGARAPGGSGTEQRGGTRVRRSPVTVVFGQPLSPRRRRGRPQVRGPHRAGGRPALRRDGLGLVERPATGGGRHQPVAPGSRGVALAAGLGARAGADGSRHTGVAVMSPSSWRVVTLDHRDLAVPFEEVVRLIDTAGTATGAAYSRSDVVEALHEQQPTVVALASGALVGVLTARVAGPDAHILAFALHPQWRNRGIGSALLRALDQEVIHRGARRLLAMLGPGQVGELAFANQGFAHTEGLHLYTRDASMVPEELAAVERYGGQFPPGGLWDSMKGFSATKELLERRVVAPLSHTELADQLGLAAPGAVLLFGPPGTGKTSFARATASRLRWAFVELHPSLLGQGAHGAATLRDTLDELRRVDHLVCFIDEADEIASDRAERPDVQPLVNELLKAIPQFKARPGRLMVMATNTIAAIDPALLRPGAST